MKNTHHDTPETDAFKRKVEREEYNSIEGANAAWCWFAGNLECNLDKTLRELHEARKAPSGRTVSCSQCNESAKKVTELESKVATLEAQKNQWRMSSVCREKNAETQAMRELLREIRDDEVNAQDEADKFLRDHEPSELSKMREAIKEAEQVLSNALFVHQAITTYASQDAVDKIENQKHCDNMKAAIAKLTPFLP